MDIAVDVSAMSVNGGVVIYGVAEDKEKLTFTPNPIALGGLQERITSTVVTNVHERLEIDVKLLTIEQTGTGFVVVEVPASVRAPHMVEVKGHYRYYGRASAGNILLTEAEVSRLYDRRQTVESEAHKALDTAIGLAPLEPVRGGVRGDLHLVARPLFGDSRLRERVLPDGAGAIAQAITARPKALAFKSWGVRPVATHRSVGR